MSGILRLESLTKGNTLKQGDKTPLKYRLFDADGEKLNIAGKSAKVRLVYPDFLTIGYEKGGLTVAQDDTVTFTIDSVIPSRIYHVEIIVDDKFIFPSRADESKFTVDKSSLGTEANIIEIVGVDAVVRKAVDLINEDPSLIIDEDKLVGDIISNTGIGNINEYYQAFNDLKPKAEQSISRSLEALTKSQNALNVANGIDAKATNALSLSESADTLSKSVQEQFNQVIIDGDSSVEAAQARVDASGQTNPTLKARLDKEHNEVTAQLAQKADDSQVRKKSNPITLNDLDGETLGIIQDGSGGTPINIESVPRDGSVTPAKTDFLNIYKDLFDFNKHIAQATISLNTSVDYIFPAPNQPNAKLFYVPVDAGKTYTVRAEKGSLPIFNAFSLAFANDTEINTPTVRVFDRGVAGALDAIEETVTNVGNHKYLLIRADHNPSYEVASKIEVFEGHNILGKEKTVVIDGAEVALKDDVKDELSNYKLPQKSVTPEMTTFLDVSENLYDEGKFIEKGTIQLLGQTNFIYPSSNSNAKLFYIPILEGETYTLRVEETTMFNVFSVALSNGLEINSPIEIIKHVYNEELGSVKPVETQSFTFNNSNNYKYLLIRADNTTYSVVPPIYVYKGSEIPTTPTAVKINSHQLALLEDLPKTEDLETSRYKTYYELPEIIKAPSPAPSHQEIYGLYDELVSNKTKYNVEMTILGTDGQGNELRSYKFSKPAMINDYGFERTKVGIMSGLHGGERHPVYALHKFMKDLSENEHNNEVFDRIMTNIDFYIIPIGNPSGWNNYTRQNWNGVNLNRNFDAHWETTSDADKGSSPASEEETQLIQNWMIDNELDYFTDFHVADMGVHEDAYTASWFQINDNGVESARAYYRALNLMTNLYSKKYDELPNDLIYGHIKKVGYLSQSNRFAAANGIEGSLLEISTYIKWFEGDIYKVGINWAAEMIGNFMIELTRKHIL